MTKPPSPTANAQDVTASPWIEWNGGECPVRGKNVDICKRDGCVSEHLAADRLNWAHCTGSLAGYPSDITAYRVVQP